MHTTVYNELSRSSFHRMQTTLVCDVTNHNSLHSSQFHVVNTCWTIHVTANQISNHTNVFNGTNKIHRELFTNDKGYWDGWPERMQFATYFLRFHPWNKHRAIENCGFHLFCCQCISLTCEHGLEKRFESSPRFLELRTIITSITYTKQSNLTETYFLFPFTCLGVFFFRAVVWSRPADPANGRNSFVRRWRHVSYRA